MVVDHLILWKPLDSEDMFMDDAREAMTVAPDNGTVEQLTPAHAHSDSFPPGKVFADGAEDDWFHELHLKMKDNI